MNKLTVLLLPALLSSAVLLAPEARSEAPGNLHVVSTATELLTALERLESRQTILLNPGVYVVEKTVVIEDRNQVTIVGRGWGTEIQRKGDGDLLVFRNSHFCRVKDLMLTGDREAGKGSGLVFAGGSSSSVVDYCRVCLFPESGIRFAGEQASPQSSNTVRDCHMINNTGHQLWSAGNNDFYIIGNQFGSDRWGRGSRPLTGCLLDESSAGTYSMNYHWGNLNAFRMTGGKFNRIENNRFEESSESGMVIGDERPWSGGAYNIILGNTIHTNSQGNLGVYPAVVARNAAVFQFCSNQILSWDSGSTRHKHGLVLEDTCRKWIVKDNIVHHSTEDAIVYGEDAGHVVKDNIVD